ncbi:DDE_3 domain-containing protein [Trichonephila clavipes]|nr:DDE_3 domain-containing protein [Trichonephila clavipes]
MTSPPLHPINHHEHSHRLTHGSQWSCADVFRDLTTDTRSIYFFVFSIFFVSHNHSKETYLYGMGLEGYLITQFPNDFGRILERLKCVGVPSWKYPSTKCHSGFGNDSNMIMFSLQSDSRRTLIWKAPSTRYHKENTIERHRYGGAGWLV